MTWPIATVICVVAVCLTLCFILWLASRANSYKIASEQLEHERKLRGMTEPDKRQSGFAFGDGRN